MSTQPHAAATLPNPSPRLCPPGPLTIPLTLWAGTGIILLCEALLFCDVYWRGGLIAPTFDGQPLPQPEGSLGILARWVAINMTVLCWSAYLLVFDGLLTLLAVRRCDRSINPCRHRPNRFVLAGLSGVPVWCFFDWVNFSLMHAWSYHGLPPWALQRYPGYFLAFAAITPAMLVAAHFYQHLGLKKLRTRGLRIHRVVPWVCLLLGVIFLAYPFLARNPTGNLTLWVSLMFLLDPLNFLRGAPSILGDWSTGRWGRTLSLMAAGLTCGVCWEFWNYWALAKWTYHLPFLGFLESNRLFEMPLLGFLGFLPFAVACWAVLNTVVWAAESLGLCLAECLPDQDAVL